MTLGPPHSNTPKIPTTTWLGEVALVCLGDLDPMECCKARHAALWHYTTSIGDARHVDQIASFRSQSVSRIGRCG